MSAVALLLFLVVSTFSPARANEARPVPVATAAEAVLAGGCFWGVEAVFEHVRGVQSATSGFARYSDPSKPVAVEAVRIVYDPAHVSYRQLLEIFFLVAHDPTTRDRQGPDQGPEYRAVVLYQTRPERGAAEQYVAELTRAAQFRRPIVTEIRELVQFTVAAAEHQDYGARHPSDPYILQNDAPKLARLRQNFPVLYQARRAP